METESNDKYNNDLDRITTILYKLRGIEFQSNSMSAKYKKAKILIKKVYKILLKKRDFVIFRPMWEELHDRMVYYYDYLNNVSLSKRIPVFHTNLHNEAVRWWLKCKKKGILSKTLLHFDTHEDMGIPSSKKFLLTSKGTIDYRNMEKGSCGQIFWPVTCILLSEGVNNIIWCMPKWVYDTDITIEEQALVHYSSSDKFRYIRPRSSKKDQYRVAADVRLVKSMGQTSKMDFYQLHEFSRVKVATKSGWNKLAKLIQTEGFILDIDLDFFVTNGDKFSKSAYMKDFGDLESTGRVHDIPSIVTPRAAYEDDDSQYIIRKLNEEFRLIEKRVKTFLHGLAMLKKAGHTPCCINISDSTPSFFSGYPSRAVWTNSYTPKYFVPALHSILSEGLRKLYG